MRQNLPDVHAARRDHAEHGWRHAVAVAAEGGPEAVLAAAGDEQAHVIDPRAHVHAHQRAHGDHEDDADDDCHHDASDHGSRGVGEELLAPHDGRDEPDDSVEQHRPGDAQRVAEHREAHRVPPAAGRREARVCLVRGEGAFLRREPVGAEHAQLVALLPGMSQVLRCTRSAQLAQSAAPPGPWRTHWLHAKLRAARAHVPRGNVGVRGAARTGELTADCRISRWLGRGRRGAGAASPVPVLAARWRCSRRAAALGTEARARLGADLATAGADGVHVRPRAPR